MRLDLSRPVLLIALAETVIWAALFYMFPILLLRWEGDFGWSRAEVAPAFTVALVVSALASPLAGRLIDAGFSRVMFPAAALLGSGALAGLTLVETKVGFYGLWAVIGLACAACLYEPCFAFLTRRKGVGARAAITTVTLIAGFASTICFPIADALADAYGWRAAALSFAAAGALIAAPLFAIGCAGLEGSEAPRPTRDDRAASRAALSGALRRPVFWLIGAAFPAVALTHGMTISHLMPILDDRGAGPGAAVLAASLIGPFQVAGRVAIALIAGERSAASLTLIAFLSVALSCVALLSASSEPMIFAAIALFGAGYGVLSITRPVVAAEFLGREGFGAKAGALALPYIACTAAAPTLAALLWGVGGYDLALAVGAGLAVAGAALVIGAAALARS